MSSGGWRSAPRDLAVAGADYAKNAIAKCADNAFDRVRLGLCDRRPTVRSLAVCAARDDTPFGCRVSSLDRHALREVARFVDVAAELDGEMIGEELQRDHSQDGADVIGDLRDDDNIVGDVLEVFGAGEAAESSHACSRFSRVVD